MAKNGATKDYGFGQKNNWRRWLWNEILRRTDGRERNQIVLYLAGRDDLDRRIATAKGVPSENMVAVDRNKSNVDSVRADGNAAICADAIEVLRAWPSTVPVCVIALDFCSGLICREQTRKLYGLILAHPSLNGAVVAVNFMRGRDKNEESEYLRDLWSQVADKSEAVSRGLVSEKHRGMAFSTGFILHALSVAFRSGATMDECKQASQPLICTMNPKPFSYKSGSVVFDSVVWSPVSSVIRMKDERLSDPKFEIFPKDAATARKVSASLAVRTRRIRP